MIIIPQIDVDISQEMRDEFEERVYKQFIINKVELCKNILNSHLEVLDDEEIKLLQSYIGEASSGNLEEALDILCVSENVDMFGKIAKKCAKHDIELRNDTTN